MAAIVLNHPKLVLRLLSAGARTDLVDARGYSALKYAEELINTATVHLLCEHDAGVHAWPLLGKRMVISRCPERPELGGSLCFIASFDEKSGSYVVELEDGGHILQVRSANLLQPMKLPEQVYTAFPTGAEAAIARHLDAGAPVDTLYEFRATATKKGVASLLLLASSCIVGHEHILSMLLRKGAEVNLQCPNGTTALMACACRGEIWMERVDLLLQAKADVNLVDYFGRSPLMFASGRGHEHILSMLLREGADPNLQSDVGETALMVATRFGQIATVLRQLKAGARIELKTKQGQTALMFAKMKGHDTIAKLLRKHSPASTSATPSLEASEPITALTARSVVTGKRGKAKAGADTSAESESATDGEVAAEAKVKSEKAAEVARARAEAEAKADRVAAELLEQEARQGAKAREAEERKFSKKKAKARAKATRGGVKAGPQPAAEEEEEDEQDEKHDGGEDDAFGDGRVDDCKDEGDAKQGCVEEDAEQGSLDLGPWVGHLSTQAQLEHDALRSALAAAEQRLADQDAQLRTAAAAAAAATRSRPAASAALEEEHAEKPPPEDKPTASPEEPEPPDEQLSAMPLPEEPLPAMQPPEEPLPVEEPPPPEEVVEMASTGGDVATGLQLGTYEGERNAAGEAEGHGTFRWPNGDVYEGEWKASEKDGKGTHWWANGESYEGEYKADQREGKGTYRWADCRSGTAMSSRASGRLIKRMGLTRTGLPMVA